jgi:hypothetical protein
VLDHVGHGHEEDGDAAGCVLGGSRSGDVTRPDKDESRVPRNELLGLDGYLILGVDDAANVPHQRAALDEADARERVVAGLV